MLRIARNKLLVLGTVVAFGATTILAQTDHMEFTSGHGAAYFETEYERPAIGENFTGENHTVPSWYKLPNSDYHMEPSDTHSPPSNIHYTSTITHWTHSGLHYMSTTTHWGNTQYHKESTTWGHSDSPPDGRSSK